MTAASPVCTDCKVLQVVSQEVPPGLSKKFQMTSHSKLIQFIIASDGVRKLSRCRTSAIHTHEKTHGTTTNRRTIGTVRSEQG